MKIGLLSVQVPFVNGGAEELTLSLKHELVKRGFSTDIITIPFKWYPLESLKKSVNISDMVDISESSGIKIDKVISLKFPAYYIHHPNKSLWLLHQFRQIYDIYDNGDKSFYTTPDGSAYRDELMGRDKKVLSTFDKRFTISKNVSDRMLNYNGINSEVLYPPPPLFETFFNDKSEDFLFFPSRINSSKRQELVIKSLVHASKNVKVVFAGTSPDDTYVNSLKKMAVQLGVASQVVWLGEITHQEKIKYYSKCLGVVFTPQNEDLGYVTMESLLSGKPVITCTDSGGSLEFIRDNFNGSIVDPEPESLGRAISTMFSNKDRTKKLGLAGKDFYNSLSINWDTVIERLISE